MTVRVLRLLEYVYPNHEGAEADMARWSMPANGTKALSSRDVGEYTISSTTMLPRTVGPDEEGED